MVLAIMNYDYFQVDVVCSECNKVLATFNNVPRRQLNIVGGQLNIHNGVIGHYHKEALELRVRKAK